MNEEFDLFCRVKFSLTEARFARLCRVDPVLLLIGDQHAVDEDGFLGLSLTLPESIWLTKVLKKLGIDSCPVAERYRRGSIAPLTAKDRAQSFILNERLNRPELGLADVEVIPLPWWLEKSAFGFISRSEKMALEGRSPGGLTICVDKGNGDILQPRQLLNFELMMTLAE